MDRKKYSTLLIWSAALISVVRYAGAFVASDMGSIMGKPSEALTILMGITGVGMGLLDSIGTAFLFNGWRLALPRTGDKWKPRFKILTFFVSLLFFSGLAILTPYTVSRVAHLSVWEVLGSEGTWVWSLFVNLAPWLILGGVVTGNANLITSETYDNQPKLAGETFTKLSHPADSGTLLALNWRKIRPSMTKEDLVQLAGMSTPDIMNAYGLEKRTAQHWRQYAREELNQN